MAIKLRPYQLELKQRIYDAWAAGHRNVLAVKATGLGKCLGQGTLVLLYDGQVKPVEEIKAGDLLMGPDSRPRTVLSTCTGESDLFVIFPVKGDPWICNDIHVLTLKHTVTDAIIDIPLDRYLTKSTTFKHLFKQFRVGVDFPERDIPIDPYLVGLYLAEGSWRSPHITTPEPEIRQFLEQWCAKNEMKCSVREGHGCWEIGLSDVKSGWGKNKISKLSASCTLSEDRWIPKEFLINSREIRSQVLAGLLDGDGYRIGSGFEIITKYPSLNRDIIFLARSLGLAANSTKKIATIKKTDFKGEYFRITIWGSTSLLPLKVARKIAPARKQKKDVLKTGFKTEPIGKGRYFGFELDGDGRFLLGDFTVTHNTKTFCTIAMEQALGNNLPTAIIVHRKELVQQISLTLAEEGIVHGIIAPRSVILGIVGAHRRVFRKQYYDYNAPITVVSVDTLNARILKHEKWAKSIRLWITDEAAHLLKNNKWGRCVDYFPNAVGLGVTATPRRLDKKGLGKHADGVFDTMVEGPGTRWGIDNGFLCRYKIAIPPSDYHQFLRKASDGADYSKEAMTVASQRSHIIGDVVTNYQRFALGKQAILFASDISTGSSMEERFTIAGIKAKLLTGLTADKERLDAMLDFQEKKIQVLLNVDLFDEGLDCPGIECVIHARPTMSVSKYCQMNGRGLRPAENKDHLIIIDHVGNVTTHGLPDARRRWTLDRIVKKRDTVNLLRVCSNVDCNAPYDRALTACPWCGTEAIKNSRAGGERAERVGPEEVDGDLDLMDMETLREMEEAAELQDPAVVAKRAGFAAGPGAAQSALKNQIARIDTQKDLANVIAQWAGKMRHHGYTDRQIHKKFYLDYGMTITRALSEPRADMLATIERLKDDL